MEKNSSNNSIFYIIIILILIIGLVGMGYYTFMFKSNNSSLNSDIKNTSDNSNENSNTNDVEEINVNDPYIKFLYSYVYGYNKAFNLPKNSASELSDLEKTKLAANFYNKTTSFNGTEYVLEENDVKYYYELIFGENTYHHMDEVSFECGTAKYNGTNYSAPGGCGGVATISPYDSIIEATRNNDKIEITAALVYILEDNKYHKGLDNIPLGDYTGNDINNASEAAKEFINNNKDKLTKYIYTFTKKGLFYYYSGFEIVQ